MMNRRYPISPNGQPVSIEYRCDAIVDDSSVEFAKKLQETLNANTNEGFVMQTMLGREKDQGLVLVFQRATLLSREQLEQEGEGMPHPVTLPPGTRH